MSSASVTAEATRAAVKSVPFIVQGVRLSTIILVTPLFFGVGHLHHVYFLMKQGWSVAQALQPVRLQ